MVEPKGVIFEEREELMVSPTGGNPTLRIAHFLKPSVNSIDGLPSPFLSVKPTISELKNLPLKVKFKGWQRPHEKWRMWVANLHSKYQSISKKAGIFEAIMGSKYSISRHQDLVLGLAEKWCPKTNTFIFLWGEATVTLEDMMVLGGYSVLVQLWACEKFPTFRPTPISITHDEPRPARWHKLKQVSIENVRLAIDSAEENFQWRPYVIAANNNWLFPKFYGDKEQWVSVVDSLDKELESFAQCLRVCELVGLHCIQKYLPHRVAMQFGIDQDLPGHVAGYSKSPVIAWSNYNSSIGDEKLYIPPRLFEPDVTTRYFEWWKQSMYAQKDAVQHFVRRPRNSKRVPRVYSGKMENYNIFVPPSSSPTCHEVDMKDSVKETNLLGTLSEKKLAIDANPLTVSLCQSASHSTTDDGAAKNDLQMIPMTCRR
uniref:Aminotransferase-like plant mobile domain-containing protein n=1 Tax=Fagus sylvatica TaxID=28930 RepID=A0A2N9J6D8_FAGSY